MRVVRPRRDTRTHRDVEGKIISKIKTELYSLSTTLFRCRPRKEFRISMSVEFDVGVWMCGMTQNIVSEKLHSQRSSVCARNVIRKRIQFSAEADP
jgi:hypothetical protein